jgi:DNA polymerase III sliding clamp (beta) subunit (PCNA family)
VTATNLEYWISVNLPELADASPSAELRTGFVLPHKSLTEALKYTPGRETITLSPEEGRVVLTTSGSRLSLLKTGQPHDFPPMPSASEPVIF